MPTSFEYKQSSDLNPELTDPATKTLSAGKLIGQWVNTDPGTRGLAEIRIEQTGEEFKVSTVGVGPEGPIDWPAARAEALANLEEEAGQRALALAVTFHFDFMSVEAYLRVNKGVLVIVHFSKFRDASGRSSYVNREFFYRKD